MEKMSPSSCYLQYVLTHGKSCGKFPFSFHGYTTGRFAFGISSHSWLSVGLCTFSILFPLPVLGKSKAKASSHLVDLSPVPCIFVDVSGIWAKGKSNGTQESQWRAFLMNKLASLNWDWSILSFISAYYWRSWKGELLLPESMFPFTCSKVSDPLNNLIYAFLKYTLFTAWRFQLESSCCKKYSCTIFSRFVSAFEYTTLGRSQVLIFWPWEGLEVNKAYWRSQSTFSLLKVNLTQVMKAISLILP